MPITWRVAPPISISNRFGTAPNDRSLGSTSRGRQRHAGSPLSVCSANTASSYGGMIGDGSRVLGSVSLSQLLDAVNSTLRSTSMVADDHTLPQVFAVR